MDAQNTCKTLPLPTPLRPITPHFCLTSYVYHPLSELINYSSHWNHRKTIGFVMFSGAKEVNWFAKFRDNSWVISIWQILVQAVAHIMFLKIGVLKNFANFTGKDLCWSLIFNKVADLQAFNLLKRDSKTGVFLWNLRNF